MTFQETFKKIINQPELSGLILIVCPDTVRQTKVLKEITKNSKNILIKIPETELTLDRLKKELSFKDLFSASKTILIKNTDNIKADILNSFVKYLASHKNTLDDNCLIFLANKVNEKSIFLKELKSLGAKILELEELKGVTLKRWVEKELKSRGVNEFETIAINLLLELGANNPDSLINLIEHVSLYLEGETLNEKHLLRLFSSSSNSSEFKFIEDLSSKSLKKTLPSIIEIINSGKNSFMLMGLLAKTFSQYLSIKSSSDQTQSNSRTKLQLPPWLHTKLSNATKNFSKNELILILSNLLYTDSLLKNKSLGAENLLFRFVMKASRKSQ